MKQGTVWVLTFSLILFGVLLGFGLYMPANRSGLIIAGIIFLIFGIGVSLPDIIPLVKRAKRAHDIQTGKIDPTKKLSHYKGRRRSASRSFVYTGEEDQEFEDQLREQSLAEDENSSTEPNASASNI